MLKVLGLVALCLTAVPALGGDVSEGTLSTLGLSGMTVLSDADGMQVRGLSSNGFASGGSRVFGQLVFVNPVGQNFIALGDTNTNRGTAENDGLNVPSNATTIQGSAINGTLIILPSETAPGFSGSLGAFAGNASNAFAGRGAATAN